MINYSRRTKKSNDSKLQNRRWWNLETIDDELSVID
jgi:hypothetical protein